MSNPTSKYSSELHILRPLFPDWDEEQLAGVLVDTKGNVEEAAVAIAEGKATQFLTASRKSTKKPTTTSTATGTSSKLNGHTPTSDEWNNSASMGMGGRGGRGGRGRGRGVESTRGARGGRGGLRGGRGGGRGGSIGGIATGSTITPTPTETPTGGAWAETSSTAQSAVVNDAAPTTSTGAWGTAPRAVPAASSAVKTNESATGEPWGSAPNAAADEDSEIIQPPVVNSNAEEFTASGGWGDAPSLQETDAAAKATGWENAPSSTPIVAPPVVDTTTTTSAVAAGKKSTVIPKGSKMSWAQIARPPPPKVVPVVPVTTTAPKGVLPPPGAPSEAKPVSAEQEQAAADKDEPAQNESETAPSFEAINGLEEAHEEVSTSIVEEIGEPTMSADAAAGDDAGFEAVIDQPEPSQTREDLEQSELAAEPTKDLWAQDVSKEVSATATKPAVAAYNGPPGFNPVVAAKAAVNAPRTSSRNALRNKAADGQAVIMPGSSTVGGAFDKLGMQFGSLSFGSDGTADEVPQETSLSSYPAPTSQQEQFAEPSSVSAAEVAIKQASPMPPAAEPSSLPPPPPPTTQTIPPHVPAHPAQQVSYGQAPTSAWSASQLSQYGQQQQTQAQPQQIAQPQQQQYYQQGGYGQQQQQQAAQQTEQTHAQQPTQQQQQAQQPQQQQQQQSYYQSQDPYGQQARYGDAQQGQHQQHQQQSSAYGSVAANAGPQSHLGYGGQPQIQQQQPQYSAGNDMYDSQRSLYDSYSASGYPRANPTTDASKQTGVQQPQSAGVQQSTQGQQPQPQSAALSQQGLGSQQQPPAGFYSQMANMGYYAPYNPYFQYAQGPSPAFQQYYPMTQPGRAPYQPTAPSTAPSSAQAGGPPSSAPAATPLSSKPAHTSSASPYGVPTQNYPNSAMGAGYDDSNSYLRAYGVGGMSDMSKPAGLGGLGGQVGYGAAAAASGAGGLHSYLGVNTPPASAPSLHSQHSGTQPSARNGASTTGQEDSDPYKNAMSAGRTGSASTMSSAAQGQGQQPQQSSQPQQAGQTQQHPGHHPQGFPSYGYNSGVYGNAGAQGGGLGGNGSGGWDAYGYGGRQGGAGGYWG